MDVRSSSSVGASQTPGPSGVSKGLATTFIQQRSSVSKNSAISSAAGPNISR